MKRNREVILIAVTVVVLLLIPLIAMQFSDEINWSAADFIVAGALLFATGLAYTVLSAKASKRKQRIISGGALLVVLVTIWAQLAVGIFD